jgi:hypothetical protein
MVAVRVATTEPNDIFPLEYCVKTIIAPPQPGRDPKAELTNTSNFGLLLSSLLRSILKNFSKKKKIMSVPPTKVVTFIYASAIVDFMITHVSLSILKKKKAAINKKK